MCKIWWFKRKRPEFFSSVHKFLLLEDYLIFRLTGAFVTQPALQTSTGYFDIVRETYWREMLDLIGVSASYLPDVRPCGSMVGPLTETAAAERGLTSKTVVSTGAMDQAAAAVGAGNVTHGIVTETTGTALVIAAATRHPDLGHPARPSIYKHYRPDLYLILPYCSTAGIVLKWFKDEFCAPEVEESKKTGKAVYSLLDKLAEQVPPGSNGLIVLPHFAESLSPDINPSAKGRVLRR